MKIVKIAKDFSRIPGARYPEEGDYSGQDFRIKVLLPAIQESVKNGEKLTVDLDGTAGLGTSFLEESFGGLVRNNSYTYNTLKDVLVVLSREDPDYVEEVWSYIKVADEKQNN